MERVHTLINKLQEQINNNQKSQQLLATAQMLVVELSGIELPEQIGKVTVWMPSVYFSVSQEQNNKLSNNDVIEEIKVSTTYLPNFPTPVQIAENIIEETEHIDELLPTKEIAVLEIDEEEVLEELAAIEMAKNYATPHISDVENTLDVDDDDIIDIEELQNNENEITEIEPINTTNEVLETETDIVKTEQTLTLPTVPKEIYTIELPIEVEEYDEEIAPTLQFQTQIKETFEINDLGLSETKSVNEILKVDKKEIATSIIDTPIKDLRKAIGINDKYKFINELFQGDENSYERSIKTINGFAVYPEAEHWIKRELHTKLCWVENNESVKQFDQLVRRRFL